MPRALLSLLLPLLIGGCLYRHENFSQVAEFSGIRAQLGSTPPTEAEQDLLRLHQPLLYIPADSEGPLDFYRDYIAQGVLQVGDTRYESPTPQQLNAHKNNPQAVFTHHPTAAPVSPVAYGGIHHTSITLPGEGERAVTFLSYHFAFRSSGLPADIPPLYRTLANTVADSEDWHQLDHYTAAYIALSEGEPFAVILQQHNYMRTYLIGGKHFPAGRPIALNAARSSNELYPHSKNPRRWRSVGFLNADTVDYLLELSDDAGLRSADDLTHGERWIEYALEFLPPDDAFYIFEGWLGERRILPGRDGPPGAIYRTLPQLWQLNIALPTFYWTEGDKEYAALLKAEPDRWRLSEKTLAKLRERFGNAWGAIEGQ